MTALTPEVVEFRQAQKDLQALAYRDLLAFWRGLDPSDAETTAAALQAFLPTLVRDYGEVGAATAADFYDDLRSRAETRRVYTAVMGDAVPVEQIRASTRWAVGPLFGAGKNPGPEQALANVVQVTNRLVLASGRNTIAENTRHDPEARGFQRVTSGGCRFCRFLAARGAVYSADSATFAAHGHCSCSAVPSWDPNATPASAEQYLASARRRTPAESARLKSALDEFEAPATSTDVLAA